MKDGCLLALVKVRHFDIFVFSEAFVDPKNDLKRLLKYLHKKQNQPFQNRERWMPSCTRQNVALQVFRIFRGLF